MSLRKRIIRYAGIALVTLAAAAGCGKEEEGHSIANHPEDLASSELEERISINIYDGDGQPQPPVKRRRTKVTKRMKLIDIIRHTMRENRVPAKELPFILSVIRIESDFNSDCIAPTTGAGGLFQQLGMRPDFFEEYVPSITEDHELRIFNPLLNGKGTRYLSLNNGSRRRWRGRYGRKLVKLRDGHKRQRDSTVKVLTRWYRRGKMNRAYYEAATKAVQEQYWNALAEKHSLFDPYIASLISTYTLYSDSRYFKSYRCYGKGRCFAFSEADAEVMATARHHAGSGGVGSKMKRFKARNAKQYIRESRRRGGSWGPRHAKYLGGFVKRRRQFEKLYNAKKLTPGAVRAIFGKTTSKNLFSEHEVDVWESERTDS